MANKVLIFSAPSGSGKSTIVNHILGIYGDRMEFSISATTLCDKLLAEFPGEITYSVSCTTRAPRGAEVDGRDYFFLTPEAFRELIAQDAFVEYEEVYADKFYGTLKKEVERIWNAGHIIIFDVDVKGGVNLKKYFGEDALSVFIQAPSVEVLRERLIRRGTDSPEAIEDRVAKAAEEMAYAPLFDYTLVNDDLQEAYEESEFIVADFLADGKVDGNF